MRGLLPTLSVSANTGWSYAIGSELSTIGTWSLGGSLTVPLFNGGATHGAVRSAAGNEIASVRALDAALLGAVRDVESALIQESEQRERHEAVQIQVDAARQAYDEARDSYLSGVGTFVTSSPPRERSRTQSSP